MILWSLLRVYVNTTSMCMNSIRSQIVRFLIQRKIFILLSNNYLVKQLLVNVINPSEKRRKMSVVLTLRLGIALPCATSRRLQGTLCNKYDR